jgi:heme exporter protein C
VIINLNGTHFELNLQRIFIALMDLIKNWWWKIAGVIIVLYSIIWGLGSEVPALPILHESIRNLYFHVTMWFAMIAVMLFSSIYSVKFLRSNDINDDLKANAFAQTGILFGTIGILTGSLWARFTWGAWWVIDPKLNGAAISMLIYLAYMVLRNSLDDEEKRGRVAAVYNIFAFVIYIVLIRILPLFTDTLHPGSGGNAGFSNLDVDDRMKWIFRPAVIGWILIATWIATLIYRTDSIKRKKIQSAINNN